VKSGSRWLLRAGQLLLVAAIIGGVYRRLAPELSRLTWSDVLRWAPRPVPLVLATAVLVGVYVAHAFLWRRIMRDLAVGDIGSRATVRLYFLASLGRYLPGKIWQLAGLALLARRAGLPPARATACALLGQFAFLTTGLLFLALLLPEWRGGAPAVLGMLALLAAALGVAVLGTTRLGTRIRDRLRTRMDARTAERLTTAFDLADRIRVRDAIAWLAAYGVTWIALGLAFSIFVSAFVPEVMGDIRHLSGTIAASYLAGYVTLVPAGLGVRESAMVLLLAEVPAIPAAAALVIAVLSRVWFTVAEVLPLAVPPAARGPAAASSDATEVS
jgi:hypothetical protein